MPFVLSSGNDRSTSRRQRPRKSVVSFVLEGGICGIGENYTYFVRPGDPNYVAFIFRGYGFCYDDETCSSGSLANTDIDEEFNKLLLEEYPQFSNSEPFDSKELTWTLVMLPQCTEDFHAGAASVWLGNETGTFHFQGATNIDLVLNEIRNGSSSSSSGNTRHNRDDSIGNYVEFDDIKHLAVIGVSGVVPHYGRIKCLGLLAMILLKQ